MPDKFLESPSLECCCFQFQRHGLLTVSFPNSLFGPRTIIFLLQDSLHRLLWRLPSVLNGFTLVFISISKKLFRFGDREIAPLNWKWKCWPSSGAGDKNNVTFLGETGENPFYGYPGDCVWILVTRDLYTRDCIPHIPLEDEKRQLFKLQLCNLVPRVLSPGSKREDPGNEVASSATWLHTCNARAGCKCADRYGD